MAKINRVSIYDMDGTIVDSSHRYRTIVDENGERIDLPFWKENAHLVMDDSLLPLAAQYHRDLLDENCFVITGGAIKMSQKMQDHPDTNNELEKLMEARRYLKSNDVFDDDSFFELLTE